MNDKDSFIYYNLDIFKHADKVNIFDNLLNVVKGLNNEDETATLSTVDCIKNSVSKKRKAGGSI